MLSNLTYLLYVLLINNLDRFIEQGTQNTGVPCFFTCHKHQNKGEFKKFVRFLPLLYICLPKKSKYNQITI